MMSAFAAEHFFGRSCPVVRLAGGFGTDLRCAVYSEPSCKDEQALCGFDSGCDRELWKWTSEPRLQQCSGVRKWI